MSFFPLPMLGCLLLLSIGATAQTDDAPRFSRDYSFTREKTPTTTETPATTPPPPAQQTPAAAATSSTDTTIQTDSSAKDAASSSKKEKDKKNNKANGLIQPDTVFHYTHTTDRRYLVIQELDWEEFFPARYQQGTSEELPLKAGQVRIQVQGGTLLLDGIPELTPNKYQIVSKTEGKVGFVYELMDTKNQPARFKVVVDQNKYVNLLYFYSKTLGEHTFFLAEKTDEEVSTDNSYFTPKSMYFVRSLGNLVDKELHPYAMIKDVTISDRLTPITPNEHITLRFSDTQISMPEGTFDIKEANSYAYNLEGYPSVRSLIEVKVKSKPGKIAIFLNFKQQIEFIQISNTRYFLKP